MTYGVLVGLVGIVACLCLIAAETFHVKRAELVGAVFGWAFLLGLVLLWILQ